MEGISRILQPDLAGNKLLGCGPEQRDRARDVGPLIRGQQTAVDYPDAGIVELVCQPRWVRQQVWLCGLSSSNR
jgi:hypothetical protein